MEKKSKKEMKSRKYGSLTRQLSRADVHQAGYVAKLFYECFVENIALISEKECIRRKIITGKEGEFKVWRSNLVRRGFLTFDLKHGCGAGKRILDKINGYKMKETELVTKGYVDEQIYGVRVKVEDHETRVAALENLVDVIIEAFDPPGDEEKRKKYSKDPDGLLRLINARGKKSISNLC